MAELIVVSVAMMPATTISNTPQPGMNTPAASVSGVSEPARSFHGTAPSVTRLTVTQMIMVTVRLTRMPRGMLRSGLLTSSASSAMTSKPT